MTKIKIKNPVSSKDIVDNIIYSPYYPIACRMMEERGIKDPDLADLFETFHEIAKIDNKVNRPNG